MSCRTDVPWGWSVSEVIGSARADQQVRSTGTASTPAIAGTDRRSRWSGRRPSWATVFDLGFLPAVLIALGIVLTIESPYFLTGHNLVNVLSQTAVLGIVAAGSTFVIIGGDLDLSVGANLALTGVVASYGMTSVSHSVVVGVLLGLLVGVGFGLVNGLVSTYVQVPSFITTLGMMVIGDGIAVSLSSGAVVGGLPASFGDLANANVAGVPSIVWLMVGVFVVGYVVLHRTAFGLRTYAVGGNSRAARLSGLKVERVRIGNFVLCAVAASIAGLALASQVQAGQPNAGTIYTLYGTAAVVLGGTSLYGGRGGMLRTVFGVLLIGTLENGLGLLGVSYSDQQVAVGVVFILAASSELLRRRILRAGRPVPTTVAVAGEGSQPPGSSDAGALGGPTGAPTSATPGAVAPGAETSGAMASGAMASGSAAPGAASSGSAASGAVATGVLPSQDTSSAAVRSSGTRDGDGSGVAGAGARVGPGSVLGARGGRDPGGPRATVRG